MMEVSEVEDLERLPGLYRPWDLAQVILPGRRYWIEYVGILQDGGALFAIYVCITSVLP